MKIQKVYIAASSKNHILAQQTDNDISVLCKNYQVISDWYTRMSFCTTAEYYQAVAKLDIDQLDKSDLLIVLNPPMETECGGGKHIETGYALSKNKRIITVGKRTTVFHYLPQIEHVCWGGLMEYLLKKDSGNGQSKS